MGDPHQELLRRLETEAMQKQEHFIQEIAGKLKRNRVTQAPVQAFRGAPAFWQDFQWPIEERIERFLENFRAAGGHGIHLKDMGEVRALIAAKAREMSARHILRQGQPELTQLKIEEALPGVQVDVWNSNDRDNWKAKAAGADFGIIMADYAAAYTGSITVLSGKSKGRSVSLLPTVLFVVIPVERLKTRLGEILLDFDHMGRECLPAGIHFISGPSRSADIENDLTIGVHGPGIVYAIIVDEKELSS